MALVTSTTQEISDNIIASLEASLNQTIPLLPKSFARVLAKVLAALYIILFKYCGSIFLQMFVATASNKATEINGQSLTPLQEWGVLIGVGLPVAATQAQLAIAIDVTNEVGTLATGTQLVGSTNGVTYLTLGAVSLTLPSGSVISVADNGDTQARYTTSSPHGLNTGQTVTTSGFAGQATYNTTDVIVKISDTEFDIVAITFVATDTGAFDSPVVSVIAQAVSDQQGGNGSGVIGNLDTGATMDFANPLANVDRTTTVLSQFVTGADGESTEAYRKRVIDRFQKIPQGGATADYEIWSEEVAGIINVYPYRGLQPGEVDVFSEATVASSGDPDGIPTQAQLDAVEDSIDFDLDGLPTRRPANAAVNSNPISRTGFDVDVSGIDVPTGEAQVEIDITTAVTQYFLDAEPFVQGLTIPPRTDSLTVNDLIALVNDIVTEANGTFTTVVFRLDSGGGDITDHLLGRGEKAKLVDILFLA